MKHLSLLPLLLVVLLVAGCANTYAGKAEQTHQTAFEATDTFLKFEQDYRDRLPQRVTDVADDIRIKAPPVFLGSWDAIQAYKANPTEAGKSEVSRYLQLVQAIAAEARAGYIEGQQIVEDR